MTENQFRRIALGMDGAIESAHMGHPDFRANGRIFATLRGDRKHGMVVLTPQEQVRFIAETPEAFSPESGAWGRQGCTRVTLAAADEEALGEAMTIAWRNAMMKTARKAMKQASKKAKRPRR